MPRVSAARIGAKWLALARGHGDHGVEPFALHEGEMLGKAPVIRYAAGAYIRSGGPEPKISWRVSIPSMTARGMARLGYCAKFAGAGFGFAGVAGSIGFGESAF